MLKYAYKDGFDLNFNLYKVIKLKWNPKKWRKIIKDFYFLIYYTQDEREQKEKGRIKMETGFL